MRTTLTRIAGCLRRPAQTIPRSPAPERGCFARIAASAAAIAAVALVVSAVPVGGARADGGTEIGDLHIGGGCNSQYKVQKDNAGCLSAWWDNTPPASTGVAAGSTMGARNECSNYGKIVAHVDTLNTGDNHFHLTNGSKKRGKRLYNDVSSISCCMNWSDLCHKQQVEPKGAEIIRYTGTGTSTETVRVGSHERRYLYCQEHPEDIYCRVDPKGDAFTEPECVRKYQPSIDGVPACNCGDNKDELCTAADCDAAFDDSPAVAAQDDTSQIKYCLASDESCDSSCTVSATAGAYSSSVNDDGECVITAQCHGGGSSVLVNGSYVDMLFNRSVTAPLDDVDDLVVCNPGRLKTEC